MAATVEDTFSTLLTLSQPDDQASVQGVETIHAYDAFTSSSSISYFDVQAYKLSLEDDTRTINQMESLLDQSNSMLAMVYSYRQCSNALPKMLEANIDETNGLYREAFDILDSEVNKLRELHQWHLKACDLLASDLGWYWRGASGPSWTHMWLLVKVLDSFLLIDQLIIEKTSLTNDMAVYTRSISKFGTSRQNSKEEDAHLEMFLSIPWPILTSLKARVAQTPNTEDLTVQLIGFCLENLDLRHTLVWQERMALLRALSVLLVLISPTEKDAEFVFRKRLKLDKVLQYFKKEPVLPGFQDSFVIPGIVLLDLSPFFRKLQLEGRIDMPLGKLSEIDESLKLYNLTPNFNAIYRTHEEVVLRFTTGINKVWHLKHQWEKALESQEKLPPLNSMNRYGKDLRDFMLSALTDCILFCSKLTERIAMHYAWKLSLPVKLEEAKLRGSASRTPEHGPITEYELAVCYNLSHAEKEAIVKVIELIRGVCAMVLKAKNILHEVVWEAIHGEIQEFVNTTLFALIRKHVKVNRSGNKLSGILHHLRAVSMDAMKDISKTTPAKKAKPKKRSSSDKNWHRTVSDSSSESSSNQDNFGRAVPPTFGQLHCMQHLVHILLLGSASVSKGGLFFDRDLSTNEIRELHVYLHRLLIFPSLLDFQGSLLRVTDFSFLWLRELYMERENVIQFPVDCSPPWQLVETCLEDLKTGRLKTFATALVPLSLYTDAFNFAVHHLKQQFLAVEIEAEVDLAVDILVEKLSEVLFSHFKQRAASNFLDVSFVENCDKAKRALLKFPFSRYTTLFEQTHFQVLGRVVDLRALLAQRINALFRKNMEYILERMDSVDFCSFWETKQLVDVLSLTHSLFSEHVLLSPFDTLFSETSSSLSLHSFSSKIATYVKRELVSDLLPNFSWSTSSQRFVRLTRDMQRPLKRPTAARGKDYFLYGSKELNRAFSYMAIVHSQFVGLPHVQRLVALLGPHCLPLVVERCLNLLADQVDLLVGCVENVSILLPMTFNFPPFELGFKGCMDYFQNHVVQLSNSPMLAETVTVLRDIGSLLAFLSLLDIAVKESETSQLVHAAPWLGVVSGQDGQLQQLPALNEGQEPSNVPAAPLSDLCQQAAMSAPDHIKPTLVGLLQGAQVAEAMYWGGVHGESLFAQTVASLIENLQVHLPVLAPGIENSYVAGNDRNMQEFHAVYSAVEFVLCGLGSRPSNASLSSVEVDNDAIAWGASAVIFLLGQNKRFQLNSFVAHMLRVKEFEDRQFPESETFLNRATKASRLHSHVFSLVNAHIMQ